MISRFLQATANWADYRRQARPIRKRACELAVEYVGWPLPTDYRPSAGGFEASEAGSFGLDAFSERDGGGSRLAREPSMAGRDDRCACRFAS